MYLHHSSPENNLNSKFIFTNYEIKITKWVIKGDGGSDRPF